MDIGKYTFAEFRQLAQDFHGYAAPGLLIGGFMVEYAKRNLPEGTLFEAVVETKKCLPDAVQLLTLCSTGNNRLKICNLGRYAISLFDKHTGKGVRVSLDSAKVHEWPEIAGWFLKLKPKNEQNSEQLEREIEQAGESICRIEEIRIQPRYIGHSHMSKIACCPVCGEAYPYEDGPICRGCQGDSPYVHVKTGDSPKEESPKVTVVPVEKAVGKKALHDMTRIVPEEFKGPEFHAGQVISAGDVCRLQQMGRFHVAVAAENELENASASDELVHENTVAEAFAKSMAGAGIRYSLPPREGKIDFTADRDGLFTVDHERLMEFNLVPHVMCATRQDGLLVTKGSKVAGTRAIPLYISQANLRQALDVLQEKPLFSVEPLRKAKVGILVTGTEVFQGIIEDKFIPIITAKVTNLACEVLAKEIVPDDRAKILEAISSMRKAGVDLIITTGGLSVDPDDVTRAALYDAGLTESIHGIPLLPGTMSLIGVIRDGEKCIQVLGVPACALYCKITAFDILLPRLLANRTLTRKELARLGEGGLCMSCHTCTWPKCWFGK